MPRAAFCPVRDRGMALSRAYSMGVMKDGRADLHGVGSSALRALRKAAVDAHVQAHGQWCPGHEIPAHEVALRKDLCADHLTPVGAGGDPAGPFGVLCRSCNARKGKGSHMSVTVPTIRSRAWL